MLTQRKIADAARAAGALVVENDAGTIIVFAKSAPDRLDVAGVAKLTGASPRRIREAARLGELRGSELGERALSFARADVLAWLDRNPIRVRALREENPDDEADIERRIAKAGRP